MPDMMLAIELAAESYIEPAAPELIVSLDANVALIGGKIFRLLPVQAEVLSVLVDAHPAMVSGDEKSG